jgi:hypothetical protein
VRNGKGLDLAIQARTAPTEKSLQTLRAYVRGEVICPDDKHYDLARRVWNGRIDRFPALIVRCRNFPGDEGEVAVRASYRANYERLVALKNTYDPTNLFHLNQNIVPERCGSL